MTNPMDEITRRAMFAKTALLCGATTAMTALAPLATATPGIHDAVDLDKDREFVMGAGMTAEEAECWRCAAEVAGKFFALPELHPMDAQEIATAVHVIQNKLLSRPTYRRYLELAKASAGK